jgi:hypothetical protein
MLLKTFSRPTREALSLLLVFFSVSTFFALFSIPSVEASNCNGTSVPGLSPLNDLGNQTYLGYRGGLYPNGTNRDPQSHLNDGLVLAGSIIPLNSTGNPSTSGKVVLVSIGMSNTNIETQGLIELAKNDSSLNPKLVIVNGAEGGEDAHAIVTNPAPYWSYVNTQLSNAGVTSKQVEAAWLKEADASPSGSNITYAATLSSQLTTILQMMRQQFPNLKLTYLSSRIYAGYASSTLNPEPYAYTSGFSVKWTVEEQINGTSLLNYKPFVGPVQTSWIAWGPYMWANGLVSRSDGLTWTCSDFQSDGTHPSIPQGQLKVGSMLLNFFKTEPTAAPWFINNGVVHDVAVTGISVSRDFAYSGVDANPINLNVTVANQGGAQQTFAVSVAANSTVMENQTVTVGAGKSMLFSFGWSTASLTRGVYTLTAHASTVTGETNRSNNNLTWGGTFTVMMKGDVNGDCKVNIVDLTLVGAKFGTTGAQALPEDLDNDGIINVFDLAIVAQSFGLQC